MSSDEARALVDEVLGTMRDGSQAETADEQDRRRGSRPWRSEAWPEFRDTSPDEPRWLVHGLLPAGALAFIAGPPKAGKTWLALAFSLALASGRPLLDRYAVPEEGSASSTWRSKAHGRLSRADRLSCARDES